MKTFVTVITTVSFWQWSVYASPGVRRFRNAYELPHDDIAQKPHEVKAHLEAETDLWRIRFLEGHFSMSVPSPNGDNGDPPPAPVMGSSAQPVPPPSGGEIPSLAPPPTSTPLSTPSSEQPANPPTEGILPGGTDPPVSAPYQEPTPSVSSPESQPVEPPTDENLPGGTEAPVPAPNEEPTPTSASDPTPTWESQPVEPSTLTVSTPTPTTLPVEPPTEENLPEGSKAPVSAPDKEPTPPSGFNPTPTPAWQPVEPPTPSVSTPGSQPVEPPTDKNLPGGTEAPVSAPNEEPTPTSASDLTPTWESQPVEPSKPTVSTPAPLSLPVEPPTDESLPGGTEAPISVPNKEPTPAVSAPTPVSSPVEVPTESTVLGCADSDSGSTYVTFTYEMETLPYFEPRSVQKVLEKAMNEALSSELLDCPNSQGSDVGIVKFDSLPEDTPAKNATCSVVSDPANNCVKLDGIMEVYYKPGSDPDTIEYRVRSAAKSFLDSNPNIPDLARTSYDGPDITNPPAITDPDEPGSGTPVDSSSLSNKSVVVMALASVGFVVAVGMVTYFRLRKAARMDQVPYVATLENESSHEESSPSRSGEESTSVFTSGDNLVSSFSSILPNAYRVDSPFHNVDMGTIPESDVSDDHESGLLLSEGYSTPSEDSSIEFPYFGNTYMPTSPVLGARPRTEEELEESL